MIMAAIVIMRAVLVAAKSVIVMMMMMGVTGRCQGRRERAREKTAGECLPG